MADLAAAAAARSVVEDAIHAWRVPVDADVAVLLTSELVTNAVTAGALHGQRETARKIREDPGAHYVLFIKAKRNCT